MQPYKMYAKEFMPRAQPIMAKSTATMARTIDSKVLFLSLNRTLIQIIIAAASSSSEKTDKDTITGKTAKITAIIII